MNFREYHAFFPPYAREAVEALCENGFDAYLVGGCVRDFYMGRSPHDFDITTDATSDEIIACFQKKDKRACLIGGACGTVGVGDARKGEEIEITPYRTESGYYDHRHPETVTFVKDISEDLSRRDFTVNSLAVGFDRSGKFGVIDLFGGIRDIENRVLRCVGDAEKRFDEDALRMLRAVRFAATLNFTVADETKSALTEKTPLLSYVSGERKSTELRKLLCAEAPERVVRAFRPFLSSFLGEIEPNGLDGVSASFCERLFYLTRGQSERDFSNGVLPLKLSGDELSTLQRLRGIDCQNNRRGTIASADLARYLADYGYFTARYFAVFPSPRGTALLNDRALPKTLAELSVGGNELRARGFSGKEIGEALHTLLYECLNGTCKNTSEELLNCAEKLKKGPNET